MEEADVDRPLDGLRDAGGAFAESLTQAPADPRSAWVEGTAHTVTFNETEWAVTVDWAENANYVRVPAAVTVSCLGGNRAQPAAPGVEPVAISRSVLASIPWVRIIEESRADLVRDYAPFAAIVTHDKSAADKARTATQATVGPRSRDEVLRLVAHYYRQYGGQSRGRTKAVLSALQLEGVQPMRRGRFPADTDKDDPRPLSLSTVYRWIADARAADHDLGD